MMAPVVVPSPTAMSPTVSEMREPQIADAIVIRGENIGTAQKRTETLDGAQYPCSSSVNFHLDWNCIYTQERGTALIDQYGFRLQDTSRSSNLWDREPGTSVGIGTHQGD